MVRAKIAGLAAAILAAVVALNVALGGGPLPGGGPRGLTQGGGSVDVFVGGTPTPTATATPTATPGAGNLWVDTTATTGCARAGTAGSYNASTDCTWDQANDLCQGGDTARVRGGTYSTVLLTGNTVGRTSMCTFAPSDGSATIVATSGIGTGDENGPTDGTDWFTIDGDGQISTSSVSIALSNDIVIDGVNTTSAGSYFTAATDVTLRNMDMCCTGDNTKLITIDAYRGDTVRFTLEYSVLHDQTQTNDANHFECVYANGPQGFTVRGVLFYGCKSTGDMLITKSGADAKQPINILIENSTFEDGTDSSGSTTAAGALSIQDPSISMPISGCIIRNNLWPGSTPPDLDNGTAGSGCTVSNNAGAKPTCNSHTYSKNTWRVGTCTGDNAAVSTITNSTNFPNQASHNYVPSGSWAGCNQGSGTSGLFAPLDRAGVTRPVSTAPDLGPYEVC